MSFWVLLLAGLTGCGGGGGGGGGGEPPAKAKLAWIEATPSDPRAGETMEAKLYIAPDVQGVAGLDLALSFNDQVLAVEEVTQTDAFRAGNSQVKQSTSAGQVAISMARAEGLGVAKDPPALVSVRFRVNANAQAGTAVDLKVAALDLYDYAPKKIPLEPGQIGGTAITIK